MAALSWPPRPLCVKKRLAKGWQITKTMMMIIVATAHQRREPASCQGGIFALNQVSMYIYF